MSVEKPSLPRYLWTTTAAGLCFACPAVVLTVFLALALSMSPSQSLLVVVLPAACSAAFWGGLLGGRLILSKDKPSGRRVTSTGAVVWVLSVITFSTLGGAVSGSPLFSVFFFFFLLWGSFFTPLGVLVAWVLTLFRPRFRSPPRPVL